ncbi:MAG TPA: peptidase M23, partial [Clostridiales bacterium]|nr:peptidase M23 [Clostridiales bacterium]
GQTVACGDTVGAVGSTALAESGEEAHLHFAMRRGGSTVDPAEYVPET